MEEFVERLVGKAGRHLYAYFCVGVVLIAVTFVHYAFPVEQSTEDARQRSRRRLAALHAADF